MSILTLVLCTTYIFSANAVFDSPDQKFRQSDSLLLKTHWKQMGGFERQTPDHLRLGCWSTALAQIMYYHRLKPFGSVVYTSSKGYRINEVIDSTQIDFDRLSAQIDSTTQPINIQALAQYSYYAALAVQKDFGTDHYMHKLAPASLLEQHYKVKSERYISWRHILPYTSRKLETIIRQEINQKRPLFLHFANLKNFGHSVVIDGYTYTKNTFLIHLNQGQGGPQDGWYNFRQDILHHEDRALRVLYTFKPYR